MDSAKVIRAQKENNAYNAWVCGEYEIINWWLKIINISSSADKKVMTVSVFGYLIVYISTDFYDFISPFSP